jgi:hypothetical protein
MGRWRVKCRLPSSSVNDSAPKKTRRAIDSAWFRSFLFLLMGALLLVVVLVVVVVAAAGAAAVALSSALLVVVLEAVSVVVDESSLSSKMRRQSFSDTSDSHRVRQVAGTARIDYAVAPGRQNGRHAP